MSNAAVKDRQIDAEPAQMPALVPGNSLTPMDMIDRAVASGANVETLGKLMDLQERWEKNEAKKAYAIAIADAKAELPPIIKDHEVRYDPNKPPTFKHETLPGIAKVVDPILSKHGLSYRHRSSSDATHVTVTCIMEHVLGYSEETSLTAKHDNSGGKNGIQAVGSSATYLQRYTLKLALGIAASNDDDGKAASAGEVINDDQAEQIRVLITDTKTDLNRFLKWAAVPSVSDLTAAKFAAAVAFLNAKKTQKPVEQKS